MPPLVRAERDRRRRAVPLRAHHAEQLAELARSRTVVQIHELGHETAPVGDLQGHAGAGHDPAAARRVSSGVSPQGFSHRIGPACRGDLLDHLDVGRARGDDQYPVDAAAVEQLLNRLVARPGRSSRPPPRAASATGSATATTGVSVEASERPQVGRAHAPGPDQAEAESLRGHGRRGSGDWRAGPRSPARSVPRSAGRCPAPPPASRRSRRRASASKTPPRSTSPSPRAQKASRDQIAVCGSPASTMASITTPCASLR